MALNPLDRVVRDLADVKRQLAGRSQINHSSLEDSSIPVYDADGSERLRIGVQDDGTHAIKYVQGPPPPRPTAPVVSVDGPVVRVRWDGILMGGHIPEDFARIDVHFALASGDLEDLGAVRGSLATVAGNETVLAATQTGTYRVGLVAVSQSRARSDMSDVVEVDVTLVDIEGALDAVVDNARGGSNHYTPTPPAGTDHDPDRDLWFDTSEDEDGLVHYTAHRWDEDAQEWVSIGDQRTQAIQDAQREFEQSTSQALSDVQQVASGAQSAADAAAEAAGTAMSTAETARDEAESKAAAAQAAAEAHAEAVAEAERLAAIAAASDDASAKAAAAEAAAKAEAAQDASAKAAAAQAAAEAKAQAAQDAADAAQSSADDARSRADAAHSAAGSAADAADAAMQAATHNAKNMWSTENPSGTAPRGTIWFKIDPATKNVVGQWQQTAGSDTSFGSNWEKRSLTDALFDNIDAGKIGTGYLDVAKLIRAGAIQADKLLIGTERNMIPNGDLSAGSALGWPSTVAFNPDAPDGLVGSVDSPPRSSSIKLGVLGKFPVTPGDVIVLEAWLRADKPNSRMYVEVRDQDGAIIADAAHRWTAIERTGPSGSYLYPVANFVVPTTWVKLASTVTIRPGVTSIQFDNWYANHVNGSERTATQSMAGLKLYKQIGGTLIEPGSVNTPHLAAKSITGESGILANLDAGVITYGFMSGARLESGSVDTPQLSFGAATGDILSTDALNFKTARGMEIIGSTFRAGDSVEITEEYGIRQFGPDGALNISLPSDGSEASFRGDLSARTLTATGRMSIQGPGAIASGGVLELESGVVPPVAGPQITNTWDRVVLPPLESEESADGIAWGQDHWWRVVDQATPGKAHRVEKINADGQLVDTFETEVWALNGITARGSELFLLGIRQEVPAKRSKRYVYVYGTDGQYKRSWEYSRYGTGTYQPSIAHNGSQVLIAQSNVEGELWWHIFNQTTGELVTTHRTGDNFSADVTGFYYGSADFGSYKAVVAKDTRKYPASRQFPVFDAAAPFGYLPELSWFAEEFEAPKGLTRANGAFYSLRRDGNLTKYQPLESGQFVGDDDDDWWGAVAWASPVDPTDPLKGTQLTPEGPATRFRYLRRSILRRQNGDVPNGVEQARFYVTKKDTTPTREDLRYVTVSSAPREPSRILSITANWETRGLPSETNTFVSDKPGEVRSTIGNFRVDGTGAGEWGPLEFHADGSMSGLPKVAGGRASLMAGGSAIASATVTLPAGRFTSAPAITVTPRTGGVNTITGIGVEDETPTSFKLGIFRTGGTYNTEFQWTAIERG